METNEKKPAMNTGTYWVAGVFIAVGLLMLGKNLGLVNYQVYNILVSWQMLLIVIGFNLFTKKQYAGSFILFAVGVYYLLPRMDIFQNFVSVFFWPIVLIIGGVLFLATATRRKTTNNHWKLNETNNQATEEGHFHVDNQFSGVHHTFNDDVFKGGTIKNSFGAVELDLRRTTLPEGKTYLTINCNFGGVEIYAPTHWNIKSELHPMLGGYEDSRLTGLTIENDRVLIIQGQVSFGGIEIKG